MSENKTVYFERLISEIKSLQENVQVVSSTGTLPFSFFKESIEKTQEISRLLHELEFMQVDDLKDRMERLIVVLSEKELEVLQAKEKIKELEETKDNQQIEVKNSQDPKVVSISPGNIYADGLALPEYRNPSKIDEYQNKEQEFNILEESKSNNKSSLSINDVIKTAPALVDLKRGISLNDRFIFQRELFGNDHNRMNSTIEKLNSLKSYEDAEDYIKENVSADLNNPTVADFLSIIKKGFK